MKPDGVWRAVSKVVDVLDAHGRVKPWCVAHLECGHKTIIRVDMPWERGVKGHAEFLRMGVGEFKINCLHCRPPVQVPGRDVEWQKF